MRTSAPQRKHVALTTFAKPIAAAIAAHLVATAPAHAEDTDPSLLYEEMTIVGSRDDAQHATGSAHFIGPEQLERLNYSDIQRIAREVPGVSIQVEDGYGLRPNISIRGVASERSGRITLLEDNVLIAPAPYSAPSAYYFPTAGRMYAFEVVKGPAAITQGPYTIGGALNMLSTPIPTEFQGNIMLEAGEDNTYRAHGTYGGRTESGFGFLLETHQWKSDGFQSIDRSDNDTGLDVEDYTVKLSYAPAGSRHSAELKLQYADQDSDQSYLGLTDADFDDDAFSRYGLSALDNIETNHDQQILRYSFAATENLKLSVVGYNNEHSRDWFKTEGIDFDGSANAQEFDRTSWNTVVQAVNLGESVDGLSSAEMQAILDGEADTAVGSIQLRSNSRDYESKGIQTELQWQTQLAGMDHSIEFGIRYHEDEEDRLQRNSNYQQLDGQLVLNDLGELGNAGNRVQDAEAWALYVYDVIEWGQWTFSPGLRFEDIDQSRTRYTGGADREFRDSRDNQTDVWLPGLGVLYQMNDELALVAGVHKGFSAPSNAPDVDEEEAVNYELGFRYNASNLQLELIGFYSDYDNLLGECTSSSGSDCEIGDAFNGDAATVAGVEFMLSTDLLADSSFSAPLSLTYTYMNAEFDTDIADTDFFGDVSEGDPIPYLPDNQLQLTVGLMRDAWAINAGLSYIDSVCTRASCDAFEETDDSLTLDIMGSYQVNDQLSLFARMENLTGEEDIMGRQPYGARPNKDSTASVGMRYQF